MVSVSDALLIAVSVGSIILIVSNRVRSDIVALVVLLTLGISRILTPQQALSGFSNPAVITIVSLFVISDALERTGAVRWLAARLARLSGRSEIRLVAVAMAAGAALSLVMNNIAAGAVLLPATLRLARQADVPPSKVLMPLAFGTLLGGMATLFTTANIIISGSLVAQGRRALTMLDFLPLGGAMVLGGIAYMLIIGRRLLPIRASVTRVLDDAPDLTATYQLAERLWQARVSPSAPIAGQTLASSAVGSRSGTTVLAIVRDGETRLNPRADDRVEAGDQLLLLGRAERVAQLGRDLLATPPQPASAALLATLPFELVEAVVGPRAEIIGQTLRDLHLRAKFGLRAIALWRADSSIRTDVGAMTLQAGDALLLMGPPERNAQLADEPGVIVLDAPAADANAGRAAALAAGVTGLMLALAAVGLVPIAEGMLAAAVALVLLGCTTMDATYRAIEWRVVVLIAGMLPLGVTLATTGLGGRVGALANQVLGPLAVIAGTASL